ncbi:hypothetical protein HZA33_00255 [Candidatus Pacearchaeota archaeon]|nr:hypothetical protein [Candidatus Pacearchaeota archaeon]
MVFWLCIPCLTLLLYFGILSIFIPKYRLYIRDAWRCFIDKLRGRKCPVSFDKKMHQAFILWLAHKNQVKLGRYFSDKKKFDLWVIIIFLIFSVVSTYLFWLLIKFLFIKSPCAGTSGICTGT